MLSLGLMFHVASGALLVALFFVVATLRRRVLLLRRGLSGLQAGVIVDEPLRVLSRVADALGVPCELPKLANSSPAKILLHPLFGVHAVYGFERIECVSLEPLEVSFVLQRSSATIEQDQNSIEKAFANSMRVRLVNRSQ